MNLSLSSLLMVVAREKRAASYHQVPTNADSSVFMMFSMQPDGRITIMVTPVMCQ